MFHNNVREWLALTAIARHQAEMGGLTEAEVFDLVCGTADHLIQGHDPLDYAVWQGMRGESAKARKKDRVGEMPVLPLDERDSVVIEPVVVLKRAVQRELSLLSPSVPVRGTAAILARSASEGLLVKGSARCIRGGVWSWIEQDLAAQSRIGELCQMLRETEAEPTMELEPRDDDNERPAPPIEVQIREGYRGTMNPDLVDAAVEASASSAGYLNELMDAEREQRAVSDALSEGQWARGEKDGGRVLAVYLVPTYPVDWSEVDSVMDDILRPGQREAVLRSAQMGLLTGERVYWYSDEATFHALVRAISKAREDGETGLAWMAEHLDQLAASGAEMVKAARHALLNDAEIAAMLSQIGRRLGQALGLDDDATEQLIFTLLDQVDLDDDPDVEFYSGLGGSSLDWVPYPVEAARDEDGRPIYEPTVEQAVKWFIDTQIRQVGKSTDRGWKPWHSLIHRQVHARMALTTRCSHKEAREAGKRADIAANPPKPRRDTGELFVIGVNVNGLRQRDGTTMPWAMCLGRTVSFPSAKGGQILRDYVHKYNIEPAIPLLKELGLS